MLTQAVNINHLGYSNNWYDVDNDPVESEKRVFKFTIPEKNGYFYISVESYFKNTIPHIEDCYDNDGEDYSPIYDLVVYKNGV